MNINFRVGDCGKTRLGMDYEITSTTDERNNHNRQPIKAEIRGFGPENHDADGTFDRDQGETALDLMPPTHNTDGTQYNREPESPVAPQLPPALTEEKPPLLPIAGELVSFQESDDDMRDRIAAELLPACLTRGWSIAAGALLGNGEAVDCAALAADIAFNAADAYMAERAKRRAGS